MFKASKIFSEDGRLATSDPVELAKLILTTDAEAKCSMHEVKLARIEIGLGIRKFKDENGFETLTDTISHLNLCKGFERSENTFLKYTRVAGSPKLLKLAINPAISFTVLDEIASCKKPIQYEKRVEFLDQIEAELNSSIKRRIEDEELPYKESSLFRISGPTRGSAIGIIRKAQRDFGVPRREISTTGKPKDRRSVLRVKDLARIRRLVRYVNCWRILFLPQKQQDKWMEREGVTVSELMIEMKKAHDLLVSDSIITELTSDLTKNELIPASATSAYERDAENERTDNPEQEEKDQTE